MDEINDCCPECGNDDAEIEYKGHMDDYPDNMWYCWDCMDYFVMGASDG